MLGAITLTAAAHLAAGATSVRDPVPADIIALVWAVFDMAFAFRRCSKSDRTRRSCQPNLLLSKHHLLLLLDVLLLHRHSHVLLLLLVGHLCWHLLGHHLHLCTDWVFHRALVDGLFVHFSI